MRNNRFQAALAAAGAAASLGLALRERARRKNRVDFAGKSVVITGGSRGLGLVLAREFAAEGAHLAILAREPGELQLAAEELRSRGADVLAEVCDVRDQDQVRQTLDRVVANYGGIDVLVNNAGIILVGPLEHMTQADFEDAMAVHFWGPFYATWAAVEIMRRQGAGRIVNIASIGGEVAVPHLAPYSASKFALVGLSDALRAELARDGIHVTTVAPGLMRTGSHVNALAKGQHEQEYTWFSLFAALPITSTSARSAARQIIAACRYGDPALVITPQARLLMIANALFPGLTGSAMKLFNWLLPDPDPVAGDQIKSGWESQTALSPSILTKLADQAAAENNQLKGHAPIWPSSSD
jgi:NAD(P)-dependent dehydrogenase (short-subunit alcohol dehydrogenase family)